MNSGNVVAVTGASGFIGASLCRLLRARGWRVRALVRSAQQAGSLSSPLDQWVCGRLDDGQALRELVDGCEAVVHCAGAVRGATRGDFDRVNVDGLRNLLRTVDQADPAPRLMVLSSLAAREPQLSHYAASKRRAEQLLEEEAGDLRWMALRPPAVYGPGDRELLPLFRLMARGLAPIPGAVDARFSMIYVDDIALAVLAWLEHPDASSGIYSLHDGQPDGYSWQQVCETVTELCQRRVRAFELPAALLDVAARFNGLLSRTLHYAPMLTPEKLRELRHPDWVCSNDAICEVLDWQPATGLREGLLETPGWCPRLGQA